MRKAIIPLVLVAFAACSKVETVESPTPQPEPVVAVEPEVEPPKPEEPKPEPPKVAETAPEPERPQLAPEGIYFLKTAVNVENDAGIIGVKRGTQLQKVGDKYKTPAGDELVLTADQVTNEIEEIRTILQAEQSSVAALAAWKAQAAQAEQANRAARLQAQPEAPAVKPASKPVARASTPQPATPSTGLSSAAYGKTDFSDSYNAKQKANKRRGMQ